MNDLLISLQEIVNEITDTYNSPQPNPEDMLSLAEELRAVSREIENCVSS